MAKPKSETSIKDLKKSGADYNPRTITKPELDRLKKALEEFGDLSGVIRNIRTGNLVGGHQRIKIIPANATIEITEKYEESTRTGTTAHGYIIIDDEKYTYREVDWDEQREKAANIAANAHGGDWDEGKLGELLKELSADINFDIDLTGFSLATVYQTIGTDPVYDTADRLETMAEQLRKSREAFKEVQKKLEENDDIMDCYLVVVFKNSIERKKFTDVLGFADNRYVDGRELQTILTAPGQGTV